MNLVDELHAIGAAFHRADIAYAICGGIAVTMHGAVRSTKDIDLLIAAGDCQKAMTAMEPLGYTFPALPMAFEEDTPRERRVQRISKVEGKFHLALDLVFAEASLEGFLDDRVEVRLPQGSLWVVSRDALVKMKQLAGRMQDLADIAALEKES